MPNHYAAPAEQNSLYTVVAERGRESKEGKASRRCLLIGRRGYWQASTGWSADDSPKSCRDEPARQLPHRVMLMKGGGSLNSSYPRWARVDLENTVTVMNFISSQSESGVWFPCIVSVTDLIPFCDCQTLMFIL